MNFSSIGVELIVGFISLFILTKILGKTQINQITAFDFISALILGELVGNALYDADSGLKEIIFSVSLWGILIYITEYLTQKFRLFRHFIEGTPAIIIQNGKIDFQQLKKNHLDLNQLQHMLRNKGVFSVGECEYAILESDGSVSVLKKSLYDVVQKKDLHLPPDSPFLPLSLILDGEILYDNLKIADKNKDWLLKQIKSHGFHTPQEVLYVEYIENQKLLVQGYESKQ
ncbi:DUF421 domain-containing protein [Bacillus sp. 2205SS5-2]|uniref:DUF421 domain-containing protein n=1 Tax=Bacillus sp. 2205SS5-2 TaxID=3109031 RepID=UPI0030048964